MGNLKEIRTRIASVGSTQKITSAMKLVSAAKLRRAQMSIQSLRPYANKMNDILCNLSDSIEDASEFPLLEKRKEEKIVVVAITSNRGLCGAFNSSVIKDVTSIITKEYDAQDQDGNLEIVCIGKKGHEQLAKNYKIRAFNETLTDTPSFSEAAAIAESLMNDFLNKKIDKVVVVYNQFVNAATQKITQATFLPIQSLEAEDKCQSNYLFEPSKGELLNELIPKILKLQFYKMVIDSIASEHGARMTSMAKATDNASDILKELKLKYNNARQSAITTELLDIISGANALDG
ncbi:ATP synthase F1 subunit gamma [Bacteroidales bacterium OttesenSCG-928-B11]|nr:ATP synthase F1 subunit gamma [Bacteroidales bacterium OttesenSCG-928-C03]MDL2311793.1 ATP synthase F1 subunit gamma [Bacteroidales bacterium OttesenSCG-928-B11]MDL2326202.1 ATP synthase F1 subunit gamma [Bacteroidales bacterium OttesenSCG-928-A14]